MKGEGHKKQHYIPQCYLRHFSENKKSIYVYNKTIHKSYPQSISKTACEDYFYKIPRKYIEKSDDENYDENFVEKGFFDENIERKLAPILRSINEKAIVWKNENDYSEILSKEDREIFAALIGIQYLRMPNIREKYFEFSKERNVARSEMIKAFLKIQFDSSREFIDSFDMITEDDYAPAEHANIFSDQELVNGIQDQIINKIWIYYVSSKRYFYTSDNSILIKPHLEKQSEFYEGFGMKGAEIIFPIGQNVLLTMWDRNYFSDKELQNDQFVLIEEKMTREYNCYQYLWSNKEVYSNMNNFDLIEILKIINDGKEFFANKQRILVNGK